VRKAYFESPRLDSLDRMAYDFDDGVKGSQTAALECRRTGVVNEHECVRAVEYAQTLVAKLSVDLGNCWDAKRGKL